MVTFRQSPIPARRILYGDYLSRSCENQPVDNFFRGGEGPPWHAEAWYRSETPTIPAPTSGGDIHPPICYNY